MTRFKDVTYDPKTQTAVIGAGNIWGDVYEFLNPQGVNVLGGRVSGVGVTGFTLGGGMYMLMKSCLCPNDSLLKGIRGTATSTVSPLITWLRMSWLCLMVRLRL